MLVVVGAADDNVRSITVGVRATSENLEESFAAGECVGSSKSKRPDGRTHVERHARLRARVVACRRVTRDGLIFSPSGLCPLARWSMAASSRMPMSSRTRLNLTPKGASSHEVIKFLEIPGAGVTAGLSVTLP